MSILTNKHIFSFSSLRSIAAAMFLTCAVPPASAQIFYTGKQLSNPNHHDGQLSPVVGVHNIQIMRANREHPSAANGYGWTYNHQPMMAYWNGKFYVHYLCDPIDEQVPPSHTLLQTSADGYTWSNPEMLFPEYDVPEGFTKKGVEGVAHNMKAVMHQRMGWYVSKDNHLYAIGSYGVCLSKKDHNNDGNGIGRVIREIKADGTMGKIYFIYYNHDFNEKNTDFPNYKKGDKWLKKAVAEIYANPRIRMQWVEEADREDPIIPLHKDYKAYNDYTLPDGRIVAMWKHALSSISEDGGNTWSQPIGRAKGFVNSNAKIWGQRLSDGTYATVYNPSEFRWPLAISLSKDGLEYTTLNLVTGEVPPMRYGGNYKSFGPQYVRGIQEGNGDPKDGDMWLSYSVNKEDMWVCRVPVPVQIEATAHANDNFAGISSLSELTSWNIYSPIEAPVSLDGQWLKLSDKDKFDYCRIERKIPHTKELAVEFDLRANQNDHGWLQIEFLDEQGVACSRIELTDKAEMRLKGGARYAPFVKGYKAGQTYHIRVEISVTSRMATVYVDGKKATTRVLFAPAESIERVMFRTGTQRLYPTVDTGADWEERSPTPTLPGEGVILAPVLDPDGSKLLGAGEQDKEASFAIANFKTAPLAQGGSAVLSYDNFKHYVDYFNEMEDENIVQAIPNKLSPRGEQEGDLDSWQWMQENVPLFECSDKQMEQMYWFRWWSIRKHIENTPVGYAMTEFLVERNYADKWKLISSGVGHHIHESRWMRNPVYLDQILNTWYHGNDGQPMAKLNAYSSWMPYSIWQRYLVDGRKDWIVSMLPSLEWEISDWENWHQFRPDMPWPVKKPGYGKLSKRNPNGIEGMFWQTDVRDAMEETISGDRRKQYMRPSINAYMWGNDMAVSNIARLSGDQKKAESYKAKADRLQQLIEKHLWSDSLQFFGTHTGDSIFGVREAIGYMPWYVGMPIDNNKYGVAWQQISDEKGFNAPYGLTTAERRHPKFRTHGVGKCEWDGAIWPFATSQTLTGYIHFAHSRYSSDSSISRKFYEEIKKYTEAQHKRGIPYIGEYQDEVTGYWLKGDQERSRYYNHSTYCDLIITGLCGLTPREDNTVEVNPLIPDGSLKYFCLDDVLYHGHHLTIIYDADGQRYHHGTGLMIFVDGVKKAESKTLGKLTAEL